MAVLGILLGLAYWKRYPIEKLAFQSALNLSTNEFFHGSLRLKRGFMDRSLKMHLEGLEGTIQSETGPSKIEVGRVDSEKLSHYFTKQNFALSFQNARPAGSLSPGIQGRVELKTGEAPHYQLQAEIVGLDLAEVEWVNPENLKGSSGVLQGKITADGKFTENPHFIVILTSQDGKLQSKFFSALLPYLPAMPTKQQIAKLASAKEIVGYKNAALRLELPKPQQMKIFLHIRIPDYNVELNLNFDIRLEENLSFSELAEAFGILKVKK